MPKRSPVPLPHCWLLAALACLLACSSLKNAGIHARMSWSEQGGLVVVDVPPGPAAAAGLKVGDRIVSIDGKPVRTLSMKEVVQTLRGSSGTTARLEVQRGQRIETLRVKRSHFDKR